MLPQARGMLRQRRGLQVDPGRLEFLHPLPERLLSEPTWSPPELSEEQQAEREA
jgi:hypothetical protein